MKNLEELNKEEEDRERERERLKKTLIEEKLYYLHNYIRVRTC